ncbi:MAG: S8 family peptidase [Saprospiraceae bacterium]|nr:S8 family peptidase [Saprospiraceae bacterium]
MKYFFVLFLFFSISVFAQQSSKLNTDLYIQMKSTEYQNYSLIYVPALVKGNLSTIEQIIKEDGGNYKYGVKDIASVRISLATIDRLLKNSEVQRIESRKVLLKNLSYIEDTAMLSNNNVFDVHSGGGLLPQSYQGEGVLIGVIDDGFEWQHPDFLNPDSSTRIMHLWDQVSTDPLYQELFYGYGASWTNTDINNFQCSHLPGDHGSHVMGTAAGNASASGKYLGIAPKADLACVKIDEGLTFLSGFVDGVNYLFDKADASGQACAINSSVGSYSSGHDGKDLYSQLIDNMLIAKSGRALIQAGGNERQTNFHLQVDLNNNNSKTWFDYDAIHQRTHFFLYADTAEFNQVSFSFELINPVTYQTEAQTTSFNILQDFTFNGSVAYFSQVLFTDTSGSPVTLEIYVDQYEDAYEVYYVISSLNDLGNWQFTTSGVGKYDIWSKSNLTSTSDIFQNINIPDYANPDNDQSIVGFWACSDKVVTVSSYQNRTNMVNWNGDTVNISTAGYPKYAISHFSSLGPTRTGMQKPNLTAPGGQVMSAAKLSTLAYYISINYSYLDADGWHISNRGTSMAAPMVTGAVALFFQCKPYADYHDVIQGLQNSAKLDSFVVAQVLALPNVHWGYGKLDVYKLIENCLIYGCTDTAAINYNPFATASDSSCIYTTAQVNLISDELTLNCQPNPFFNTIIIEYLLPPNEELNNASITIYNHIGQTVYREIINNRTGNFNIANNQFSSGTYCLVLENNGKKIALQQLIKI